MFGMFSTKKPEDNMNTKINPIKEALGEKTPEERTASLKIIGGLAYEESLFRMHEALSEDKKQELEKILEPFKAGSAEAQDAMAKFFSENLDKNNPGTISKIINEADLDVQGRLRETVTDEEGVSFKTLADIGALAFQKIQRECLINLEEEDKAELKELYNKSNTDEDSVLAFFAKKVPNFKEIEKEATEKTTNDIKYILAEARRRVAEKQKAKS